MKRKKKHDEVHNLRTCESNKILVMHMMIIILVMSTIDIIKWYFIAASHHIRFLYAIAHGKQVDTETTTLIMTKNRKYSKIIYMRKICLHNVRMMVNLFKSDKLFILINLIFNSVFGQWFIYCSHAKRYFLEQFPFLVMRRVTIYFTISFSINRFIPFNWKKNKKKRRKK